MITKTELSPEWTADWAEKVAAAWESWMSEEIEDYRNLSLDWSRYEEEAALRSRFVTPSSQTSGLSAAEALTAYVELTEKPSVGIALSPLALARPTQASRANLRLAISTSDGASTLGAAYRHKTSALPAARVREIHDEVAFQLTGDEAAVRLGPFERSFALACDAIGRTQPPVKAEMETPSSWEDAVRVWRAAVESCGGATGLALQQLPTPTGHLPTGFAGAAIAIDRAYDRALAEFSDGRSTLTSQYELQAFKLLGVWPDQLRLYAVPTPFEMAPVAPEKLTNDVVSALLSTVRLTASLDTQLELFTIAWGFNPNGGVDNDGEPLSKPLQKGQWKSYLVGGAVGIEWDRWSVLGGLAYKRKRDAPSSDDVHVATGTIDLGVLLAALDGEPLKQRGQWRVVEGKLPPRVALGVTASIDWDPTFASGSAAESRANGIAGASVMPNLAFHVNGSLAFRLGIPFTAKLVEQKAVEAQGIAARKALQWSVPVAAAAVLKL